VTAITDRKSEAVTIAKLRSALQTCLLNPEESAQVNQKINRSIFFAYLARGGPLIEK
jgi:hypothetical protein